MESELTVKPQEEYSTLHITSTSSSSPPLSPASATASAVTVVAVVPDRVSSTEDASATVGIQSKDAPATVEILSKDAPATEEILSKDAPATEEILSEDAPATVEILTEDAPATVEILTEDAPATVEILTEDAPATVEILTEDAPATVEILEEFQTLEEEFRSASVEFIGEEFQTLEEEFQILGFEDGNKGSGDEDDGLTEDIVVCDSLVREAKSRKFLYPQRHDAPDCSYYLRTGTCRYGSNCRYNHPARKENQAQRSASLDSAQVVREKEKEDLSEKMGQQECKYYLRAGGCKFGKACRYNHSREKPMGERECPYYMRTGSCKYGSNCRFHHPDPTAVGGGDITSVSVSLHPSGALQPASTSWPSPPNETVPFLDAANTYVPMMLPPQGVHPNHESNGYQAPAYPPERSVHQLPALIPNNPANRTDVSVHNQQHMLDEFPERPGQPECSYFMKTGDCKYRSACKYNHPKNWVPKSACILSPMGLPLRPDQSICTHYHRYGICKFGAACKFDHPVNYAF